MVKPQALPGHQPQVLPSQLCSSSRPRESPKEIIDWSNPPLELKSRESFKDQSETGRVRERNEDDPHHETKYSAGVFCFKPSIGGEMLRNDTLLHLHVYITYEITGVHPYYKT